MNIEEETFFEAWTKSLKHVFENGKDFRDKDERICRENLNVTISIKDPKKDLIKPIEILNSFKKWVYPPLEEVESFMISKKEVPGYYYTYGGRAFNFENLNQVDKFIIPLLKKDKTSRRATLMFYNPLKDSFLFKKETPGMIMIDFKIRNKKIHATSIIRSNDIFFWWPSNIYQVYVLQKYIAEKLNCEIGSITTISLSAHIFEDQFENIKKVIE